MTFLRAKVGLLAGGLLVVALLMAAGARADDVYFSWVRGEGAESCVDARSLRAAVRERIGRDPFREDASRSLDGVVVRDSASGAWTARFLLREGDVVVGERTFVEDAESCSELASALVLAASLVIDPEATLAPPVEVVEPSPGVTPTPVEAAAENPPGVTPTPVEAVPEERPGVAESPINSTPQASPGVTPSWLDEAAVSVLVTGGLLPRVSAGASVLVGGSIVPRLRWQLGFRYHPEVSGADDRFAFGLASGSVGACYDVFTSDRVVLAPCAEVLLGAIRSTVRELEPVNPGEHLWGAARASFRAAFRVVGPFYFAVRAAVVVPFAAYDFVLVDSGRSAHTSWPAAPEGEASVMLHFD
jgi:hypothetical protein